jgi:hypothetical protein
MTIPGGQASLTSTLTPILDNIIEGVEDITFQLLAPQLAGHDYTIGAPSSGGATIEDDPAIVTLEAVQDQTIESDDVPGEILFGRSGGNTGTTLRVYFELGGTATLNVDYTFEPGPIHTGGTTYYVNIPGSAVEFSTLVHAVADDEVEVDETVELQLLPPQLAGHDYEVGEPNQATVTIISITLLIRDGFENLGQ